MPASRRRRVPAALTEREQRFVAEYLRDLNGRKAAMRVGYARSGAGGMAHKLLAKPAIAAAVAAAQDEERAQKRATADRVIEELARMAFANIRDFADWGPKGISMRDKALLDPEETAAIADIEHKGNGKLGRLKLYDKLAALNALAKHLGMIGGKTALGPRDDSAERAAANAELRERLMRIVRAGKKGDEN
ncbi:MAG TPA: terminase small subunit [Stellaceae bacterium]|nr:terminase small subunit [Stellaceae bacterium]